MRCGRCGRKLHVSYSGAAGNVPRYHCKGGQINHGVEWCISFGGLRADEAVVEVVLDALQPLGTQAALDAWDELTKQHAARQRHWVQRLERARYETTLARRRYEAVDPENQLVARTLEREWETALAAEQALQRAHERELARQPARLQAGEMAAVRRLAEDVPALWQAPTATPADRQMITRLMLEQVAVRVEANGAHVGLTCDWAGGVQTRHTFIPTVQRFEQLRGSTKF